MTCETCLDTISTAPLAEILADGPATQHWKTCENCSRVVGLLTAGERDLAAMLAQTLTRMAVSETAETALATAERRRVGKFLSGVFAVVLAVTIWITWVRVIVPGMQATAEIAASRQQTQTLTLKCLSPEQAGELVSPYVRSNGSAYYLPKPPIMAITVRATPEELRTVSSLLGRFDSEAAGTCSTNTSAADANPKK